MTKLRELIAEATEARAQVITLGLILGAQEGATSVMSWRSVNPGTARYLLLLEANGYTLSNVERRATGKDPYRRLTTNSERNGPPSPRSPGEWRLLPAKSSAGGPIIE